MSLQDKIAKIASADTSATKEQTPMQALSDALANDMAAVNDHIVTRMDSHVALIPKLGNYLVAAGGKRIRPLLTLAATELYNGDMKRAQRLAACVEFIHTATLLHDDVVDESEQRRGQDAANLIYGNNAAVLVGDFLFSRSFQIMTEDGDLEILRILSGASATIAEGEVMQLVTTNNLSTTMKEYIEVIEGKTAALFTAACEVGPVIAGADESAQRAMADYGLNLGIAFQIADDALDYMANRKKLGKVIGDDFREGKMTAPVLLALAKATDEEKDFWTRTIGNKDQHEDDLATAQRLFEKYGIYKETIDMAHAYGDKAVQALHNAPAHPLRDLLEQTVTYSITRNM
jgi:octaprenyl-diphosphate synthase